MRDFLTNVVLILLFVVALGYFNEKVSKLTYEISLMLYAAVISVCLMMAGSMFHTSWAENLLTALLNLNLEKFLIDGVLCFMLFAGSCHIRLLDFKKQAKIISLLALGATLLGAVFYGLLFYAASLLLGLSIPLPVCLMFGSIVAPTDPIAATSILKKCNLPKQISFIIEGESLLNDGMGVALFVCFSRMVVTGQGGGLLKVMCRELLGAIAVGFVVSVVCFAVFKRTSDEPRRIYVSLLAVSLSYLLCERWEFSGAIASVVCGVMFSALRTREVYRSSRLELALFDDFWSILDNLFNSVLYVLLGLSFINLLQMPMVLRMSLLVIMFNLLGRSGSVGMMSLLAGKLPDGYDKTSFVKLLTWGGLRGGLSVALAMSTREMLPEDVYFILLGGTYAIVFFTTIVQGLTMQNVYRRIESALAKKSAGQKEAAR